MRWGSVPAKEGIDLFKSAGSWRMQVAHAHIVPVAVFKACYPAMGNLNINLSIPDP